MNWNIAVTGAASRIVLRGVVTVWQPVGGPVVDAEYTLAMVGTLAIEPSEATTKLPL